MDLDQGFLHSLAFSHSPSTPPYTPPSPSLPSIVVTSTKPPLPPGCPSSKPPPSQSPPPHDTATACLPQGGILGAVSTSTTLLKQQEQFSGVARLHDTSSCVQELAGSCFHNVRGRCNRLKVVVVTVHSIILV